MPADDLRTYLRRVIDAAGPEPDRVAVLAGVAAHVGAAHGVPIERSAVRLFRGTEPSSDPRLAPPPELAVPELLGHVHAALQEPGPRRRRGVFITPPAVAAAVTAAALDPLLAGAGAGAIAGLRVCDPAAGGGAFLLAAARRLAAAGGHLPGIVGRCLFGVDVDPLAVAVTEAALAILGWDGEGAPAGLAEHLVCGDAVLDASVLPGSFDAVLANPPFLSQLQVDTARSRSAAAAVARRFGAAGRGYADGAAVFVLLALELLRDGGRAGVILPASVLATRDAGPARRALAGGAAVDWVWLAGETVFDADVSVCALSFQRGGSANGVVRRVAGLDFRSVDDRPVPAERLGTSPSWSFLMADRLGVPDLPPLATDGMLGDFCRATADFRDQFYGLAAVVEEAGAAPGLDEAGDRLRVLTCGLIDPAVSRWGRRTTRLAGRRFDRPVADLRRLDTETSLGPWARRRLVPKVLLATQTRVVEAVVDEAGGWLPSTPVITVETDPGRLWAVAAALSSPVLTALALQTCAGAGLSADAIKLSAKQVLRLPTPAGQADWTVAAEAYEDAAGAGAAGDEGAWRAALVRAAGASCRAYGVDDPDPLLTWWTSRLPRWR